MLLLMNTNFAIVTKTFDRSKFKIASKDFYFICLTSLGILINW